MIKTVTDDTFKELVLESKNIVMVAFCAPWCAPCNQLTSELESINDSESSVITMKMNVDDNLDIPTQLGIRSLPTIILYKDGKKVDTRIGSMSKQKLLEWCESLA